MLKLRRNAKLLFTTIILIKLFSSWKRSNLESIHKSNLKKKADINSDSSLINLYPTDLTLIDLHQFQFLINFGKFYFASYILI